MAGATTIPSVPAVAIEQLVFAYPRGDTVLDIPALHLGPGSRTFIEGPSGSGKSTLLGLLGGILVANQGSVSVLGEDLSTRSAAARDRFRADRIGFVFQQFNLLPYLSVVGNTLLPCRFSAERAKRAGHSSSERRAEAERLLGRLGLAETLKARSVTTLSIGQQQRVAVARALIGQPQLLIADEPTSALDAGARRRFVDLLIEESDRAGASVLFVSHDPALADAFDQRLSLPDINNAATELEYA